MLSFLTDKVVDLGQLGDDWGQACEEITQTLAVTEDKSKTLKKRVQLLTVEHNRVKRRQRSKEQELQKTRAIFERSLSDIRSTYEKSHLQMNQDFKQLETMAEEMKGHRDLID